MSTELIQNEDQQSKTKKNMPLVLGVSSASAAAAMLAVFGIAML